MTTAPPEDDSDAPTTLVKFGTTLADDLRKVVLKHTPTEDLPPTTATAPREDHSSAKTQVPVLARAATIHLSAASGHDAPRRNGHEDETQPPPVALTGRPADWTVVLAFVLIALGIPLLGALNLLGPPSPVVEGDNADLMPSPHGIAGPSEKPAIPRQ